MKQPQPPRMAISRRGVLGIGFSALLVLGLVAVVWQVLPTRAAPQPKASLRFQGPPSVAVGDVITLTLSLGQASNVAGYQTDVVFDPSHAHLQGLEQRDNDVRTFGRSVEALGPVETATGVTIGAYSCPYLSCIDLSPSARKKPQGANGTVRLATLRIVADQPGPLTISLAQTTFVDAAGNEVPVDLSGSSLTIQVKG